MSPKPGPHLGMAVLCERVLQEKDGVLSIIRAIDRFTITLSGQNVPMQLPQGQIAVTLVIMLKSGDARGRHTLTIWPELPSGERLPKTQMPVLFEGEDRGVNAILNIGLPITQEGVYWFEVILDDSQILTRVPLRVLYQPMQSSAAQG